jgi:hypothetical protein
MKASLRKIGHKKGMRSILVNAPPEALDVMDLQEDITHKLIGSFDYIHLFVILTLSCQDYCLRCSGRFAWFTDCYPAVIYWI